MRLLGRVRPPGEYVNHIHKWPFTVPFVCGATNLGEALRRITEGAAMIPSGPASPTACPCSAPAPG